jgi:methyl-accepting chemotaxis protein
MKKRFNNLNLAAQMLSTLFLLLLVCFSVLGVIIFKASACSTPADAANIRVVGIVALAVIFCLISLGVWNAARMITNDIKELMTYSENMAQGNTDFTVKIHRLNEFGRLAISFEKMQSSIKNMVHDVDNTKNNILNGNLVDRADFSGYSGDYRKIMHGMNKIIDSISDIIRNIKIASENVASSSNQISGGAQALSQGATEQASSIEQLSAAITEIASQVKTNAANASNANKLANESYAEVERGNEHMKQMITAITEISDSSSQIGKIIKTIEDIAFQTNILALNAAVEAARAGAAGKGFAVVADEVRNLASKSAEAAKNTTALIESSINAVQNGTEIAETTAESLSTIINSTKKTTDLINEISDATKQQEIAISQVMQGVEQISAVVQTNSASSEESAASSEELNAQAQKLESLVKQFKVSNKISIKKSA